MNYESNKYIDNMDVTTRTHVLRAQSSLKLFTGIFGLAWRVISACFKSLVRLDKAIGECTELNKRYEDGTITIEEIKEHFTK